MPGEKRSPVWLKLAIAMTVAHLIADLVGGTYQAYLGLYTNVRISLFGFGTDKSAYYFIAYLIPPIAVLDVIVIIGLLTRRSWSRIIALLNWILGISQIIWDYEISIIIVIIYLVCFVVMLTALVQKGLGDYLRSGAPQQTMAPIAQPPAPAVPLAQPIAPAPAVPIAQPIAPKPVEVPPPVTEERHGIRFASDYDYFQGFVRLKVWIVNGTETVITDCRVRLLFDEDFMRINQVDPPLPLKNDEVRIGTVNPDEKKTVAFLLDPLMCQTINLDGTLTYRDAKGHICTIPMRQQPVGVTCPIYATPDTINTATALNLAKNVLNHRDSRIYNVPRPVTCEKALSIAQGVIQMRSVRHVSDLKIKEGFGVMSIYYGISKLDNRQYIIRTTVLEETGTLELFVAADDESMLTGELAKLGQDLNEALCAEAKVCEPIRHVNISIKDSVLMRTNLLFGEAMDGNMANVEIKDSAIVRSQVGGAGK